MACIIPSVETSSLFFSFFFLTMEEQNCLILGVLTPSFEEETGGVKEREGIQRKNQGHEHCCFYQEKKGLPERAENSSEERWAENPLKICL
jgi:hypothetical protein